MKYGWLVVNGYLQSEKFNEIYEYLIKAAKDKGIIIDKVTNIEVLTSTSDIKAKDIKVNDKKASGLNKLPEFAIFWDKDVSAAKVLEAKGIKLFNSASSIEVCDDKSKTYLALINSGIKMPKTMVAPLNFGIKGGEENLVDAAIRELKLPFIIKENCGSFGAQVYLAHTREEAIDLAKRIGSGFIMQEYISSSKGRDIRIQIVGNKCVTAMLRENDNDFRANITNGGKMKAYVPSKEQIDMALKVCKEIGLDFAGVDIMFGENEEPVFCEVNSNAHFKNIMDCTGVNVAEYIIEHINNNVN